MAEIHALIAPHGSEVTTYKPVNGEVNYTWTLHTKQEASQIIDYAHEAFLKWREVPLERRAELVGNIGNVLEKYKDELAEMMADQMGKPVSIGRQEIDLCAEICRYTAEDGVKQFEEETRTIEDGKKGIITYQPLGVILGMQPWNFPCYQAVRYSVACILAGNSTVLKHAEVNFAFADKLREIYLEAGLPEGVFETIYVGGETADELIGHDKVRGVNYTGSAKVGKIIAGEAAKHLKRTVLELGGSDPFLILEDADLDLAAKICAQGRTNNAGQTCVAAKRFIVVDAVYDQFREKFLEAMKAVEYGDPRDENTQMGPLVTSELRDTLQDQVDRAVKQGAEILCGGSFPDGDGNFYPATVLDKVERNNPAFKEELFGPVASLIRAKDEEEAIELANDHHYGLGGGVFSKDTDRAIDIARTRIDSGMVNVNNYSLSQPNMPFGGVKDSGWGREHGGFGVMEFVNVKSLFIQD